MPLAASPCRSLCDWRPAPGSYDDRQLFACRGCGSQWAAGEAWSPVQADGSLPPGVDIARARAAATAAPGGGAAGSAGSSPTNGP